MTCSMQMSYEYTRMQMRHWRVCALCLSVVVTTCLDLGSGKLPRVAVVLDKKEREEVARIKCKTRERENDQIHYFIIRKTH